MKKKELGKDIEELKQTLETEFDEIGQETGETPGSRKEKVRSLTVVINNLNYVKDNQGIVLGDQASADNVTLGGEERENAAPEDNWVSRECVPVSREVLSKWLSEHYNDFEMAFLVALAVFEKSPRLWVYDMAEDLFGMMEGDKEDARRRKLTIPNEERIETAGGRVYRNYTYNHTGPLEEVFICFQSPEYAPRVLECVWNEFVFFRETLITWLENYISEKNYSKTIKAINAMAQLLQHDFSYFESRVVRSLIQRQEFTADFAVAQVMVQAYEDERYRDNIVKLFLHWARLGSLHHSLIALMMCAVKGWPRNKIRPAIESYIDTVIQNREKEQENEYEQQFPLFYAIGERKTVYFRMVVEVLYDKMMRYDSRRERNRQKIVGLIFWDLIAIDYLESNIDVNRKEQHKDMVFVKMCLMGNDTAPKLQMLWKYLWKNRETHRQTKKFLEIYLFQYGGCGQEYIKYLRQFLYSFQDTLSDMKDMEFFLRKISLKSSRPVRTAEKINQRSTRK